MRVDSDKISAGYPNPKEYPLHVSWDGLKQAYNKNIAGAQKNDKVPKEVLAHYLQEFEIPIDLLQQLQFQEPFSLSRSSITPYITLQSPEGKVFVEVFNCLYFLVPSRDNSTFQLLRYTAFGAERQAVSLQWLAKHEPDFFSNYQPECFGESLDETIVKIVRKSF